MLLLVCLSVENKCYYYYSRLALICGRISPDCCGRIKIVIIRWEDLSGLQDEDLMQDVINRWEDLSGWFWEDPRLLLFGGKTSPDCGVRIYCQIVIIRREDLSGLRREDLL